MNHNIARAIRQKFRVAVRGHNLPIPCSRGRTRKHLCDLWGELGYKTGIEIGVHKARFSMEILNRNPACHLTLIDPWIPYYDSRMTKEIQDGHYAEAMKNLKPYLEAGRATVVQKKSLEALDLFEDGSLDFIFIDGDHAFDEVVQDIIYWTKKVKKDGMVAIHDYMPMVRGGVRQAVDGYTYDHQIAPWYVICEDIPTAFWVKH